MALINKISFLSQDKSGREVVIKDTTGLESTGVTTGYGPTNGAVPQDIVAYYFTVSRMFDSIDHVFKLDGSIDTMPNPIDVAYGAPITLTTDLFSDDKDEFPMIFKDGILDINMYVEFPGYESVEIAKDTNYIVGDDFSDAYKGDAIVVNEVIYQIDKSLDNNGYTVLYIVGEFEEDADSFGILHRANTKALLTSMSENYHDYACKMLKNSIDSPEWNKVNVAASFRRAALGLFRSEVPDYYAANDLIQSNVKLLKRFAI